MRLEGPAIIRGMKLEKTTPSLTPFVLSLAAMLAAGTAGAQQPSADQLRQQLDAAAQSQSPEAEAAQKQFREAADRARSEAGESASASDGAARTEAPKADAASVPGIKPMVPAASAQAAPPANYGGGVVGRTTSGTATPSGTSIGTATSGAQPAIVGVKRIPIPPATGVGVNAPFAHDYFARFEGRQQPAPASFLDGVGLRGTVHAASLQQQIDAELEHERPNLDSRNVELRGTDAPRKQARARLPFNPVVTEHAAAEKPKRAPRPPFEELN